VARPDDGSQVFERQHQVSPPRGGCLKSEALIETLGLFVGRGNGCGANAGGFRGFLNPCESVEQGWPCR
jgi:hypothetical protein